MITDYEPIYTTSGYDIAPLVAKLRILDKNKRKKTKPKGLTTQKNYARELTVEEKVKTAISKRKKNMKWRMRLAIADFLSLDRCPDDIEVVLATVVETLQELSPTKG